jgi:FMN reductase
MTSVHLVAVCAADSPTSKTRALVDAIVAERDGELVDLSALPADALLGRTEDVSVARAVEKAGNAQVLIVATPVYRASYTGALKAFFDRFQYGALKGTSVVLVATAAAAEHYLALDTGGRALIASLGGVTAPTVVYGTHEDFVDGKPSDALLDKLRAAVDEAEALARAL